MTRLPDYQTTKIENLPIAEVDSSTKLIPHPFNNLNENVFEAKSRGM